MNNRSLDPDRQPSVPPSFAEPLAAQPPIQPARDAGFLSSQSATASGSSQTSSSAAPSILEQTLQSRLAILATLFCVTGALGLPLLWMSPAFSRLHKWIWSAIVLAYTSALIGGTWAIMVWAYRQFR